MCRSTRRVVFFCLLFVAVGIIGGATIGLAAANTGDMAIDTGDTAEPGSFDDDNQTVAPGQFEGDDDNLTAGAASIDGGYPPIDGHHTAEDGETAAIEAGDDASATVTHANSEASHAQGSATDGSDRATITLDQQLRRTPTKLGEYDARHEYRIPEHVTRLDVTLPEDATVTSRSGFIEDGPNTWVWDGSTKRPTITYRVPADRTIDQGGPIAGPGRYLFVDRGEWALVTRPRVGHSWGWRNGPRVGLDQRPSVDGEGAASDVIGFLGPHDEYQHTAHGQTFRLIVPKAAQLEEDPGEIFDSLEHASDTFRVGDRDDEVFVVAAPTGEIEWGVRGLQTGPADMWVRDFEPLDDPDNVWLHEYVHTRQDYHTAEDLRWFTEGTAVYYAALLTLQQDRIGFQEFRDRLARGTDTRFSGVRLADRGTWQENNADYHVGALVAGELDRQIRLDTDSERSFQTVFSRMNAKDGTVTAAHFEEYLRGAGGERVGRAGDRYTRTTDRPAMWTQRQHDAAFGTAPARFTFSLSAADDGYRVSGPYRNDTVGGAEPIVLVPGETLELDANVFNAGETPGDYDAVFRINGEERDRTSGRIDAGASDDLTFAHEFDDPGEYVVAVDDESVRVSVREPAQARVTEFDVDATEIREGSSITLSVTVINDRDLPGVLDVPIVIDGETVDEHTVRLGANDQRTISVDWQFDRAGTYVVGLGDAFTETIRVTVTGADDQPGFGVVATLIVLLTVAALAVRTARYR